ncbi:TonB-dependent receptor [Novosphingobium sp. fls2-241-R2A-195]|jgi:outer membrane receptor protein involved in Fe transport|uniref:TonB-dependent receptor n=1 Tax=Novosphingobium sp. fls2-241-R2A-195 TaxID=3040296 RepID=UPI002549E849|nr:TonB-dependent receptor [Novosphingobium sp. fls2-241-R2A-195]
MIRFSVFLSSAAVAALSVSAHAQQMASADETTIRPADIIVTGEKSTRTLQETPTSIAVTTAEKIERETLISIQDVYNRTANLSETYGSSGFTIRGVSNTGVGAGGQADAASVYVDGAPIPKWALYGGPTDMWDVQQVEVLRGPQSTIQGLNALAGGIVITTKDPSLDRWTGDARVLWSEHDDRTFSAAVGGPIVEDELGIRLSAERRADGGLIRNLTRGGYDDELKSLNLRGKVKWTPAAIPGLEAVASYNRVRRDGGYLYEYARTDTPDFYDHRVATGDQPTSGKIDSDIAVFKLSYPLADHLKLSSVTSWNRSKVHSQIDTDGTPQDIQAIDNRYLYRTLTQELRLNYEGERLSGLLGAWYYRRSGAIDQNSRVNIATPTSTIAALLQSGGASAAQAQTIAAAYATQLPVIPVLYRATQPEKVETMALFGDARFKLTDQLTLIGGFRFDHERNRYAAETVAAFNGTLPDVNFLGTAYAPIIGLINQGVLGLVDDASSPLASNRRTFNAFLPKFGVSMDWTPDLTTAFTVQRAYRSGGSSQNPARAELVPYDPEYSWNYEGSLRSKWLGGKLVVNANVFYMQWKDQQVTAYFGLNAYDYNTVNAAGSHLYGFELEANANVAPGIDIYASVGHVRTKFDDFDLPTGATSTVDLTGTQFPYAPRWTLSGGINATVLGGVTANLNANYRTSVFTGVGQDQDQYAVAARTVVNGRLGYETDNWQVFVFARNIFNEKYKQYEYAAIHQAILGDPQTFGVGAGVHW